LSIDDATGEAAGVASPCIEPWARLRSATGIAAAVATDEAMSARRDMHAVADERDSSRGIIGANPFALNRKGYPRRNTMRFTDVF
jgi:hypothetical protein